MMMSLLDGSGMTGDIWSTGAFAIESPLKDLLDSGDFTLEQLLAEDELLQELRGMHPQLLDYFATEEAVTKLVRYLILDPKTPLPGSDAKGNSTNETVEAESEKKEDEESSAQTTAEPGKWLFQHLEDNSESANKERHPETNPENLFIRFPYMACEIICCELQGVVSVLVDGYVSTGEPTLSQNNEEQPDEEDQTQQQKEAQGEGSSPETPDSAETIEPKEVNESSDAVPTESRQRILDELFSVLYDTEAGQLDDYRAGYLEKILSVLFRRRPQALSEYINTGGGKGGSTLMKAMFKHLYSHSIMQLVQRLLLPQPPHLQQSPEVPVDDEDDGNLILSASGMEGMAAAGGIILGEADDETRILQCNWSESAEALDLLLQPLISQGSKLLSRDSDDDDTERKLNVCQNSSEVLITIVQNSPLNSETMLRLTEDPIIGRLVDGASRLDEGQEFSHHESTLTATMNVLESLILQLGGYGSVGTMSILPPDENDELGGESHLEQPAPPQFAELRTLLLHLPRLLQGLSSLLKHPSCENWRSPMQFSKESEPHLLLGMSRLRIVRLLESLVLLGDSSVDSLLCHSDCLEVCLNLFWKFQWCSMLHQSVANLLVHVFEGANARSEMQEYFLVKCNLLGRLMDSFAETITNEEFSLRNTTTIPDFTEQGLVIAMKGMKIPGENAAVNAPQPNDLAPGNDDTGQGRNDDLIPVSDDDVDAALEQQAEQEKGADGTDDARVIDLAEAQGKGLTEESTQEADAAVSVEQVSTEAVHFESRDASTVGAMLDGAPAQSFRLGYMGHVIIICQALVHACSTENDEELENAESPNPVDDLYEERRSLMDDARQQEAEMKAGAQSDLDDEAQQSQSTELPVARDDGESARDVEKDGEGPAKPLMLSKLIDSHPLTVRWQEFVRTTLATETAIQSTPLGGYNNSLLPGADPLHAHRPLGDGDDFDEGSGQPNMPPRGVLGGGDMLDMDDNDLDIAASMMAGLHMARGMAGDADDDDDDGGDDSDDEGGSDGSGKTYDSGEQSPKRGYFFDDPLGNKQRDSGLGIALGNLGQYHADSDDDNGSDNSGEHSSDEEVNTEGSRPRRSSNGDVPVMNLFTGNFDGDDEDNDAPENSANSPFEDNGWSNFANFDDAFAAAPTADGEPSFAADFASAGMESPQDGERNAPSTGHTSQENGDIDDIFGKPTTHAILLEDSIAPGSDPFAAAKVDEEVAENVEVAPEES